VPSGDSGNFQQKIIRDQVPSLTYKRISLKLAKYNKYGIIKKELPRFQKEIA